MSADQPLLCGIDAGTSQVRALVFELDGTLVAAPSEPTPIRALGPDQAELDAEGLWTRDRVGAAPGGGGAAGPQGDPGHRGRQRRRGRRAAGRRRPRRWRRSSPGTTRAPRGELEWLLATVGFERLHRITGLCADPTFSLLKLLWYRRQRPELFARAQWWLNVGDYLAWRLCGERATDVSLASRTLLLDLEQRPGPSSLLDAAELPASLLPPLRPSGTAHRHDPARDRRRHRPAARLRRSASAATTMSAACSPPAPTRRGCCSTAWAPPRR